MQQPLDPCRRFTCFTPRCCCTFEYLEFTTVRSREVLSTAMVGTMRPQWASKGTMRPPLKPTLSTTSRAQSPATSAFSNHEPRSRSPSAPLAAGTKRKEREYDQDVGEETNIHVVVRCRGRSEREVRENSGVVVSTNGVKGKAVELSMGPNAISNKTYHFDKVFSPAADQSIIYEDVVSPVLSETLAGYNCTIFAYGQTGTGKTYTMSGDMTDTLGLLSDAAGIIPRVLYSLFSKIEADQLECSVKCSFIELYNEELRDLISPEDNAKLKIYDDASRKNHAATLVQGMEECYIKSASAGIKLLQHGSYRRQVAATKCNDLSSRSHTVFTITTYIRTPSETGEDLICSGKLNLVDLAGSENIQRSGAENKRAAEAGLINKSLLTLGRVINALVDKSSHVPYRESKLTRLLQDSLGGRTKTCIIATVSPAKSNLEETISTLDYAFRAKNIRNKPQVNSTFSKKTLLKEFTTEIEKLKSELIATRQRNGVYLSNEQYEEITVESESRRILSDEQKARIETMEASLRSKVQDLFNLTNNFQILRRDNDSIKSTLEGLRLALKETEEVLVTTKGNLVDETEARRVHQSTGDALRMMSQQLRSSLKESVGDVNNLHGKVDRISALQALNGGSWDSSATKSTQLSESIDFRTESFQTELAGATSDVTRKITDHVKNQLKQLSSCQETLTARLCAYDDADRVSTTKTEESRDAMNLVLEEIKTLRDDVKAKVGEGLQGLSSAAETISADVISELDTFHTDLHASYAGLGRDFKALFDDLGGQLMSQREEITKLRGALEESEVRSELFRRQAAANIENFVMEERQAAQNNRNELLADFALLMEKHGSRSQERLAERLEPVKTELVESSNSFQAASQSNYDLIDNWLSQESGLLERVTTSRDTLKARMKSDWTTIASRNASIQNATKSVHAETVKIVDAQLQQMATQMQDLDAFVARARSQNNEHHVDCEERSHSLRQNVHETFEALQTELQQHSTDLTLFEKESMVVVEGISNGIVGPYVEQTCDSLDKIRTQLQQRMTKYTVTGETPQRKDYMIPSSPAPMHTTPSIPKTVDRNKSPRKFTSPRKLRSPTKLKVWSPSKDNNIKRDNTITSPTRKAIGAQPVPPLPAPTSAGLREIDINLMPVSTTTAPLHHGHPSSTPPTNKPTATTTVTATTSSIQQPPLKRHATIANGIGAASELQLSGVANSNTSTIRLPTKTADGAPVTTTSSAKRVRRATGGREKENLTTGSVKFVDFAQSVGASGGGSAGRRLRSSPPQ